MTADSPAAILFDENGNPVGVIFDGSVYRLQVQTTLTDGYNTVGNSSNPLRIDPVGTTPQPVTGTSSDNTTNSSNKLPAIVALANTANPIWTNGNMVPLSVDSSGNLRITGSISATNPSVSNTGTTPPTSATYIGGSVSTTSPSYTNGQMDPLSLTLAGALRVDASGTTQPINGTVTANQGGAPWVENISQFGGNPIVTGTGVSGIGIPRVTVSNDSNILATQSGTWTIQPGNTANTTPWLTTINQGGNSVTVTGSNALKVDGSAVTQPVKEIRATTATDTVVSASASNVILLTLNTNRLGATFWNDSTTATLYLKLGSTASLTSYTAQLFPSGYYEVPYGYIGEIDGIWSAAVRFLQNIGIKLKCLLLIHLLLLKILELFKEQ